MLQHPDNQAAYHVDEQDQDTRHGIAAYKFAGTVHGAVEIGFAGDFLASGAGLILGDQARIQISVNRHLFTRHGVQGEAGTDFRHTSGTLGHDHKIDDDQNDEYDQPDRVIAADDKLSEGFDHLTGCIRALMPFQQDDPG